MERLLIKSISELQTYEKAKWYDVTDGEGIVYALTKLDQVSKFVIGQLNSVEIKHIEGKKKPRIELAQATGTSRAESKFVPATDTTDTKIRSVAISYAKDLACAGKIELSDQIGWADFFLGFILGAVGQPQILPEAPQSKSTPPAKEVEDTALVDAAVDAGAEVIMSSEDVKAKVQNLMASNKVLKVGTFVDMMEKQQPGVKEKGKNSMKVPTLLGSYQALTDENKITFSKSLG